jgi:Alpha/beta hydrolase domain
MHKLTPPLAAAGITAFAALALTATTFAQAPLGLGAATARVEIPGLPTAPTAVTLPKLSGEMRGPGPMFDSAPSQAPGLGLDHFKYQTKEYFVSGTAAGKPYTTRLVVRRPADNAKFSGLVLAESMHSSGAAHAFEFTAAYVMSSGHVAVEILTTSPKQFTDFNAQRYGDLKIEDGQAGDILAQVGALVKSDRGPLGKLKVRKMVLSGSSMSSGTLINYLPWHMVYRTPDMQHIYDGFMPTSAGQTIMEIDVPLIQLPTMLELENNVTHRQDSDEPGKQYRLYEIAGIGHVDSRDNVRLKPNPCAKELSTLPVQAFMSVGLYHLFRWVDQGIAPPRAQRVLLDRDTTNDGSLMALDEHGNPIGGVRNVYVDVPVAKYAALNAAATPLIPNPAAWIVKNGGEQGAQIMCRLSAYQVHFSSDELRKLYGTPAEYVQKAEARLAELEKQGWSLPVYHDLIMSDAKAVQF